jgi:hypothetical protein
MSRWLLGQENVVGCVSDVHLSPLHPTETRLKDFFLLSFHKHTNALILCLSDAVSGMDCSLAPK